MTSAAELGRAAVPAFARHETFHPRYGWLRKAFEAPAQGLDVFSEPEVTVLLGVGKNMVHAIRYWGLAYKILAEAPNRSHPRRPGVKVTPFGQVLLSEDGWDPYLERPATLWLLHWQLLAPPCMAPVWWTTFHAVDVTTVFEEDLLGRVVDVVAAVPSWPAVAVGSVKKDVDCLLRMYASRGSGRQTIDDFLDSPFRELGLLEPAVGDGRGYRFASGPKVTLPDAVVVYATLDFAARASPGSSTITVSRLAQEAGGPGRAFRMAAPAIAAALERAARPNPSLRMANPAGDPQLIFDGDPYSLALEVIEDYYRSTTLSTRTLPDVTPFPAPPARGRRPVVASGGSRRPGAKERRR